MNQAHWKRKVHHFVNSCQSELKKTTEIGKRMFNASKTSSTLRDAYEELGQILEKEIDNGRTQVDHPKVMDLLAVVKACKNDLEHIEGEMNRIRFSAVTEVTTSEDEEVASERVTKNKANSIDE